MFLTDGFLGAENRLQYLQKPERLLSGIDRVLNVFGKISNEGDQIINIVLNSIASIGGSNPMPTGGSNRPCIGDVITAG